MFHKSLPYDIPSKGPTSITDFTHSKSTSDLPSTFPPDKTYPDHSSPHIFLLSATPSVIPRTSPSDMPILFPILFPYEFPSGSPSTVPVLSRLPTQLTPKESPDKPALILHQQHSCLCLKLPILFPTLIHHYLVLYQLWFLMKHPLDHPLQALHPQGFHHKHTQIIPLINMTMILQHYQVCF